MVIFIALTTHFPPPEIRRGYRAYNIPPPPWLPRRNVKTYVIFIKVIPYKVGQKALQMHTFPKMSHNGGYFEAIWTIQ